MKRVISILKIRLTLSLAVTAILAFIIFNGAAGCGGNDAGGKRTKIKVAADIVPLADFCRQVGADRVEVEIMIPPGASPHSYELTASQMKYLSEADLLVINGMGLTPWAEGIFEKVDNQALKVLVVGEIIPRDALIPAIKTDDVTEEMYGEYEHDVYDPHIWLDPNLAVYMVEAIRDALIELDPKGEATYNENADRYMGELGELDTWIKDEVDIFSRKKFISTHSSWAYFARRYGLEQVAVIEELPGKEPTASEIAAIIDIIRGQDVGVIFTEPQLNTQVAEAIAEEVGSVVIIKTLDPLGDPQNPDRDTYIETLRHDVQIMGEALK